MDAAVTASDLGGPSSYRPRPRRTEQVELVDRASAPDLPRIFLGVVNAAEKPGVAGVATLRLLKAEAMPERGRRRRRRLSLGRRSPSRYWQAPPGIGGKSEGYAYGYG